MKDITYKKYSFPRLKRVKLHAFTLYSLRPDIDVQFAGGVLCLAGANGIGKSTFLATVNYGLTGAVPHPDRNFLSAQAYLRDAKSYSEKFFDGRIAEGDRTNAAVTIEFEINNKTFFITRGLFDSDDVREFKIDGISQNYSNEVVTPIQRADLYQQLLIQEIGLISFEQFVFLQHFIFTFDEARSLLFWNDKAMTHALFLCFGGNPEEAALADELNREAEKAGSNGRNFQYQANNILKNINLIQESLPNQDTAPANIDDIETKYQSLEEEAANAMTHASLAKEKVSEAETQMVWNTANVAQLKASYEAVFNRFLRSRSKLIAHPIVTRALNEGTCEICDAIGDSITKELQKKLKDNHCPFCNSHTNHESPPDPAIQEELTEIDKNLFKARASLADATAALNRLRQEEISARKNALDIHDALKAFEKSYPTEIEFLKGRQAIKSGPIAEKLASLQQAMNSLMTDRNAAYAKRDTLREQFKRLQRKLENSYAQTEELFVPKFRKLAGLFLGIDLDVSLQTIAPTGIKLVVELQGNIRRDENQMSESQRFFVDIALRMALIQQMSDDNTSATLFIDTPEGSLDIAYEDRAGEMFANFAQGGHDILMTANINSSKLLVTLARRSGKRGMHLNQMTGWTELSDVQRNATELFQEAYQAIATAQEEGPIK